MSTRIAARTAALLAPAAAPAPSLGPVRDRLVHGIGEAVAGAPAGGLVEVVRASLAPAGPFPPGTPVDAPFRWKPAFVRRSLGLAAVRACAEGAYGAPAAAAGPLAEEAVDRWRRTGWRTYHWEPWLAGLAPGARAVVVAEAVTWATPVWAAFDWAALRARTRIGRPDDLWTCPAPRTVRCKGRVEAEVDLGGPEPGADGPGPALVTVLSGRPGETWREELAYPALVAGLRWPTRPVPARVMGLWTDGAVVRAVEVDADLLATTADRVVEAVRADVRRRASAA